MEQNSTQSAGKKEVNICPQLLIKFYIHFQEERVEQDYLFCGDI